MTTYILVQGTNPVELEKNVNQKLQSGYQLQGGVGIVAGVNPIFYQAMYKP